MRIGSARALARVADGLERLNARHPWSHNDHFHSWILAHLPEPCGVALDVGCGRGELVAALAPHVGRVVGVDADRAVREQAAHRCSGLSNVEISDADWATGEETVDLITMVAVLHHLDVAAALRDVRRRLAPGGRFLAVGLAAPVTARDHVYDLTSVVLNPLIGYVKHPWPSRTPAGAPPPFQVRDPTLSFDQLRRLLDENLPGAELRHRIGFRHTIAWTAPDHDPTSFGR